MTTYLDRRYVPGSGDVTYEVHNETGHVAAYGRELDPPGTDPKWIASHWNKHPIDHADAEHIEHLCCDAPYSQLVTSLKVWREEMDQLVAVEKVIHG